jgi:hypothetical protein
MAAQTTPVLVKGGRSEQIRRPKMGKSTFGNKNSFKVMDPSHEHFWDTFRTGTTVREVAGIENLADKAKSPDRYSQTAFFPVVISLLF